MLRKWLVVLCFIFSASSVMAELDYLNLRDGQVVVDYEDVMNSRGDYYRAHTTPSLIAGATAGMLIDLTLATTDMYLIYQTYSSSVPFTTDLFHTPVISSSGPASGTVVNYNQVRDNTSSLGTVIYGNPVVTSAGTGMAHFRSGGGTVYRPIITWVLSRGKAYVIRIKNESVQGGLFGIELNWYEK